MPKLLRQNGLSCVAMLIIGVLVLIGSAEFGARLAHVADVPLYLRVPNNGYELAPHQSGTFLRFKGWAFNDEGLGTDVVYRARGDDVVLVGDSVVFGGNALDQPEKLGPVLAEISGHSVSPLSAGGWAFANEAEALQRRPELLKAPVMVWVSNSGDFGARSEWTNEVAMPTTAPDSALVYAFRRFILRPHDVVEAPKSAEADRIWIRELDWFLSRYKGRIIWILYPRKDEIGQTSKAFDQLINHIGCRAEILNVARYPEWSAGLYRDNVIHPNMEGNRVLAGIIARQLAKPFSRDRRCKQAAVETGKHHAIERSVP